MHVAIYLPPSFYSAIAGAIVETLDAVNAVRGSPAFTFEFISREARARSRSGIVFPSKPRPSRKMDVLVLLAGAGTDAARSVRLLDEEIPHAAPLIQLAERQEAVLAATCGAPYLLAGAGVLDGRRSTITWWLKAEARARFPEVRWQPSRLVVRHGRIYTCGAGFSGLDLLTTLLVDLGFAKEERAVRKLMALPPPREFQTPYEMIEPGEMDPFAKKLEAIAKGHFKDLSLAFLARRLGMSPRTLSRRFEDELAISPGKWIQEKRLELARSLLEETRSSISEICQKVGYRDLASFSRLFARTTGMTPGEFRKHLRA